MDFALFSISLIDILVRNVYQTSFCIISRTNPSHERKIVRKSIASHLF